MEPKEIVSNIYKALSNTIEHDGVEHAGYMAFLSMLALFPFLVFFFSITGFVGASEIGAEIINVAMDSLPSDVRVVLQPRIDEIISGPPPGLLNLAIVGAIWTASSSVEGLRTILNRVYMVYSPPPYILRRTLSILQFFLLTSFIFMSLLVFLVSPILIERIRQYTSLELSEYMLSPHLRYTIAGFLLFLVTSYLYYLLPNIKLKFRSVFIGSLSTVILWSLAASLLSFYLAKFKQLSLIYGSLGGTIFVLLFFYVVNLIFIFGAEINYIFCHKKIISEDLL